MTFTGRKCCFYIGVKTFSTYKTKSNVADRLELTKYDEWMTTYLDDYSRFITASHVFENTF